MNAIVNQLGTLGLIPVVTLDEVATAVDLGRALLAGGLPCAEITLRTAVALPAIQAMTTHCPEMLVGAGTVLTVGQAQAAVDAGARFIVTPGFDAAVVDWCLARAVPVMPGVMTPTEINMALSKGLTLLKFFPAEVAGGIRALKALAAPYRDLKFIPTGGLTPANVADYLRLPPVHACGGSWLADKALIANGQFEQITQLVAEGVKLVRRVRGGVS